MVLIPQRWTTTHRPPCIGSAIANHTSLSIPSDIVATAVLHIEAGTPTGSVVRSGVSTPVNMNAGRGRLEMVQFLVMSGADPRVRDGDGMNALHCAARHTDERRWLLDWAEANGRT